MVWPICWGTRPEGWRTKGEVTTMECCGRASVDVTNFIFAVLVVFEDFVWTALAHGKFTNAVGGCGAVDSDSGEDEVTGFV